MAFTISSHHPSYYLLIPILLPFLLIISSLPSHIIIPFLYVSLVLLHTLSIPSAYHQPSCQSSISPSHYLHHYLFCLFPLLFLTIYILWSSSSPSFLVIFLSLYPPRHLLLSLCLHIIIVFLISLLSSSSSMSLPPLAPLPPSLHRPKKMAKVWPH